MKNNKSLASNKYLEDKLIRLPIPPLKQEKRDCLMVCLQMILKFYNVKLKREELDKFFIKETTAFSVNPDLTDVAYFAIIHNLSADLRVIRFVMVYS